MSPSRPTEDAREFRPSISDVVAISRRRSTDTHFPGPPAAPAPLEPVVPAVPAAPVLPPTLPEPLPLSSFCMPVPRLAFVSAPMLPVMPLSCFVPDVIDPECVPLFADAPCPEAPCPEAPCPSAPPFSRRHVPRSRPVRFRHCSGMFAFADGACIVPLAPAFVDIFPDDVCAVADIANARAIAPASAQGFNVFIDRSFVSVWRRAIRMNRR